MSDQEKGVNVYVFDRTSMKSIKNNLRNFDKWRRVKLNGLESLLYMCVNNKQDRQIELLAPAQVNKILIIRNNKRIGNIFFLIPFVRQTRESFPHAHITLMLNSNWQGQIFDYMGINHICYSNFSAKNTFSYLKFIKNMKNDSFDLIITPNSSVGDTMTAAMLPSKNKVSHHHHLRKTVFTHTYEKIKESSPHAAFNCLSILSSMGIRVPDSPSHYMEFSESEIKHGKNRKKEIHGGFDRVIAFFRGARGKKQLSDSKWLEIVDDVNKSSNEDIVWVEILSPEVTSPLIHGIPTFSTSNLRDLGGFLKHVDGFICCDTGPLHLADAAGCTCIGIYNQTNHETFGVIGNNSINMTNIDNFSGKLILKHIDSVIYGKNTGVILSLAQTGALSNLANIKRMPIAASR